MRGIAHLQLLCGAALLAVSAGAVAQTNPDTGIQGDVGELGDIVVTATKRAQTLQEVPISVGVVSGEQLQQQGVRTFTDLQSGVPNLQIDQTNGNFAITIRGLGSGAQNLAFEQSVGLFVDGVFSGRARALQVPLLDVARVEVVRGPQGALFGKNTNAGAISVVTNRPTHEFAAELRTGMEFAKGGYTGSGFINMPVGETLAMRVSAQIGDMRGYISNRLTNRHENATTYKSGRAQILWQPVPEFEALAKVEAFRNKISGSNAVYNNLGDPGCGLCALVQNASGGADAQTFPEFWRYSRGTPEEYDLTKSRTMELTLTWHAGNWDIQSLTAHQRVSSARTFNTIPGGLPLLNTLQSEKSKQFSEELRITGDIVDNVNLTVGGTYVKTDIHILQDVWYTGDAAGIAALPDGLAHRPFDQSSKSWSPYAILDVNVIPNLNLNGSLRYTVEDKDARAQSSFVGARQPANTPAYDLTGSRKEKLWDYSLSARYQFSDEVSAYVRYATGTKGGGFISNDGSLLYNILNNNGRFDFDSERARSWEVGAKTRLFDRKLDIDIAVFRTMFSNLQVGSFNGTVFLIGNAGKAKSQGVEIDTRFRPNSVLSGGFSGAYLDAKYEDYAGGPCLWDAPSTCTPLTNNLQGARLTRAPEWKGSFYLQVDAPIGHDLVATSRGSVDYTSRSYFQGDLHPLNSMPSFARFDARLGVRNENDTWELALIGRNLSNKKIWSQAFNTPLLGNNSHVVMIGAPRMVTLEGTIRF